MRKLVYYSISYNPNFNKLLEISIKSLKKNYNGDILIITDIDNSLLLKNNDTFKNKIVKEGFDPNKSEHEIMIDRKIYRIYDSGNLKFIYNKN